jgi:hypothetical protein
MAFEPGRSPIRLSAQAGFRACRGRCDSLDRPVIRSRCLKTEKGRGSKSVRLRLMPRTNGLSRRRSTAEKAFCAQVFINVRPVNSVSSSAHFQWDRRSAVAFGSRGYHASGTMNVLPSARSTASVSSVTWTSRNPFPELRWGAFMPFLQRQAAIPCHYPVDSAKFSGTEGPAIRMVGTPSVSHRRKETSLREPSRTDVSNIAVRPSFPFPSITS